MEDLIGQYGYAVIFVGTLLEGETIFLIAAYLAHAGYFKIEYVALTGLLGTFCGDQLYFFIGRDICIEHTGIGPEKVTQLMKALALIL